MSTNIKEDIKFSIIVPTYNMAHYLNKSLHSILNQTYGNIELVCVDDASTDNSVDILAKLEKEDKRVKIILSKERKSANVARKLGVLSSQGDYVLFCDADDFLVNNALEILYNEILKERDIDILHFKMSCRANDYNRDVELFFETRLAPYSGYLYNEDILIKCFVNGLYTFTLWNKLYSSAIIKRAYFDVNKEKILRGEDVYAFFLIAFYAKKYKGISTPPLYVYNYGQGLDGKKQYTLEDFQSYLDYHKAIKNIHNFLLKKNRVKEFKAAFDLIETNLIDSCVNKLCYVGNDIIDACLQQIYATFDNKKKVLYLIKRRLNSDACAT